VKLYSDTLTAADLHAAANLPAYGVELVTIQRPRVRKHGWTFRLWGSSGRWRNSGQHGAERERATTWDQHGEWMARLFDKDPAAKIGPYNGCDDFHAQTQGKYREAANV
jgi:hypothetical protein